MSQPTLINLIAGAKAKASEVMANFLAIAQKFGSITDSDIAAGANIQGSKISTTDGTNLTNANFGPNSVDSRVLKSDSSAGSANAAVQTANHIKDHIITDAKLLAATLSTNSMNLTTHTYTTPSYFPVGSGGVQLNYQSFTPNLPAVTLGLPVAVYLYRSTGLLGVIQATLVTDTGTTPRWGVNLFGGNASWDGANIIITVVCLSKVAS